MSDNHAGADAAATWLRQAADLDASQVHVLRPADGRHGRHGRHGRSMLLACEVEPEHHAIWRTIVRA